MQHSQIKNVALYDFSITFLRLVFDFIGAVLRIIGNKDSYPLSYHLKNLVTYAQLKAAPRIKLIHSKLTSSSYEDGLKVSNLETALNSISSDNSDLFFCKLDIEGYEYDLIEELALFKSRISGLVIEFHDTFSRRERFLESLKVLRPHFMIVHTHVNNFGGISPDGQPIVYEISFLNRKLVSATTSLAPAPLRSLTPHDQPNNPNSPEIELNFVQFA